MLEATQHENNSFITLTYSDDQLPADGSVSPRELSLFLKRVRKAYAHKIRYFACGEYGGKSGRPHYHIAIFGYPSCERGRTAPLRNGKCCGACDTIMDTWGKGKIDVAALETGSAAYIAGYVSKKYSSQSRPRGAAPEFTRMSLRPGLGLGVMHDLASTLMQYDLEKEMVDVPLSLQHGRSQLPLGRYLRRKLRTFVGRSANAPQAIIDAQSAELQDLREAAWNSATSLTQKILDESLGRRIQIEAKARRKKRETV